MGTYIRVILKKNDDIKEVNRILNAEFNHPPEVHGGVEYGIFYSEENLEEDLRFVNNDAEGLKQSADIPRPMSREQFIELKFGGNGVFGGVGQWCVKISNPTINEKTEIELMKLFIAEYGNMFIDFDKSENLERL